MSRISESRLATSSSLPGLAVILVRYCQGLCNRGIGMSYLSSNYNTPADVRDVAGHTVIDRDQFRLG